MSRVLLQALSRWIIRPGAVLLLIFCAFAGSSMHSHGATIWDTPQGLQATNAMDSSRNWAGYILPVNGITAISGSWTIPILAPSSDIRSSGSWIGIGGASTDDLIQTGTGQHSGYGDTAYDFWYELLPARPVELKIAVEPGDTVSASIQETGADIWLIQAVDLTTGQGDTRTVRYHSSLSSAEWIEEVPSDQRGRVRTLADFGTVHFSDATAYSDTGLIDLANATQVTMRARNTDLVAITPTAAAEFDAVYVGGSGGR